MGRRRHTARKQFLTLAATLAGTLLVACASAPPTEQDAIAALNLADLPVVTPESIGYSSATRIASDWTQAALLLGNVSLVEPLIRPFSTQKALISIVLKSSLGFVQRVSLDAGQFQALEAEPLPPIASRPGMDLVAWEAELAGIAGTSTRGTVRLLVDGGEYFPRLIETIMDAEESIDIRTYVFDNDSYGVKIADLLRERSEDVHIKVLLDGIGAMIGTRVEPEDFTEDFEPPLTITSYLRDDSRVKVRTGGNPFLTGDHTKTTIIDGQLAFLGGMNISGKQRYEWHDLMMEVTGPVVDLLQRDSDVAWSKAGWLGDLSMVARTLTPMKRRADDIGVPLTILTTRDHDSQLYHAQVAAIRRAQSYIFIENPYFSDDVVLYELAKARRRGVDVRVILPDEGNHQAQNASNDLAINRMLRNGISVYRYPGMTHVKAAIYDGWACFGSANFDKLSLKLNDELNLGTSDPEIVGEFLERVFLPDFALSEQVTTPLPTDWTHRIAEFLSDEIL
jgi:phosphatidylserine/phosphatidylglycerophosphate/cardiolipin synthase-like enzyme